jgi:hypothetical protein
VDVSIEGGAIVLAAASFLPELFDNRSNFIAPDSGPHKRPYACSFHWFWTSQGDLIGLDVVRSDNMDRRALRVFAMRPDGQIDSLILEGPSAQWAPFTTDAPPRLDQDKPVLGRGKNWVVGSASVSGQSINAVSFALNLDVQIPGKGTGECGLVLAHLTAMDYLRVEVSGWMKINGRQIALDRSLGYTSVHFGDFLPNYAAVASVPPEKPGAMGILVNVSDSDDLKHGASLLGDKSVAYGFGSGRIPGFFMTIGRLARGMIPLGHDERLELSNIRSFAHVLLDRPTVTATAEATYVAGGAGIPIGQVILDFRGKEYAPLLAP